MFDQRFVATPSVVGKTPVTMPLRILLALAPRQTPAQTWAFNVLAAWNQLLGHFGWDRANRIMKPAIWAPDWTVERFYRFVRDAGIDEARAAPLRTNDFLGTALLTRPRASDRHDVVHFVGEVFSQGSEDLPILLPVQIADDEEAPVPVLGPGSLRDALIDFGTRLMILQVSTSRPLALRLAEFVTLSGGPAVLVVTGKHADALHEYIVGLYAGLVHNLSLDEIAAPQDTTVDAPEVTLFSSPERDLSLRFDGYMDDLERRLQGAKSEMDGWVKDLSQENETARDFLHAADAVDLEKTLASIREGASSAPNDLGTLGALRNDHWFHESDGAVPVSEIAERLERNVDLAEYQELRKELQDARYRPPRVLNANFAEARKGNVLGPNDALVAGQSYDLLVDVGPRWTTIPSIVQGSAAFPEKALPSSGDGFVVKVVLISSDFLPGTVSGEIWVPRESGRSSPLVGGKPASDAGPIALRLTVRPNALIASDTSVTARARLSLYYRNNLLQSAAVSAGVRVKSERLTIPNAVDVDYATSGSFRNIEELGKRKLGFPGETRDAEHPIALNITLNGDGDGTHRIIVTGSDANPPAWVPYDPTGAVDILTQVREELLGCFQERDDTGTPTAKSGLDRDNGKSREQFTRDLYMLALVGRRLHKRVFADVRPDGETLGGADWEKELRRTLDRSEVIQIARTEAAQYTFPWSLLYSYPLGPESRHHFCKVLSQWSAEGARKGPPDVRCPYSDKPDHQEDVICPYGFWGLKHVIEQPLSAYDRKRKRPRDITSLVSVGSDIRMGAGWTTDSELDAHRIATHRERLVGIKGVRFGEPQPNPAHDLDTVRAVLGSSAIVYFLCHGEYDAGKQEVYLGVGPNDHDPVHRIYPSSIDDWSVAASQPNLANWEKSRPLIFINGCHTVDLIPGQILNFVTAFEKARASGVIGTEVSVRLPLATEVAETLIEQLAAGIPAGRALFDLRWKLSNKGDLLGLAYSLYAMADLRLVRTA
jgi:hypothetical protein